MYYLFMGGIGRIDESSRTETIGSLLLRSTSLGGGSNSIGALDAPFVPTMQVYGPGCMHLEILEEWEVSLEAMEAEGNGILAQVVLSFLFILVLLYCFGDVFLFILVFFFCSCCFPVSVVLFLSGSCCALAVLSFHSSCFIRKRLSSPLR